MNIRYSDINHVVKSFNKCKNQFDEFELVILNNDCVIEAATKEEMNDRNIQRKIEEIICTIKYNGMKYKMIFHENSIENKLTLKPAGVGALDPKQSSLPKDLSDDLAFVQKQLDYAFNCHWDLSNINAGSIAYGGYLTDYEFTYNISF